MARLLTGLGIRHVGRKVAEELADHFLSVEAIQNTNVDALTHLPGFGTSMARSIAKWFSKETHRTLIEDLQSLGVRTADPEPSGAEAENANLLEGEIIVFTGALERQSRSEAEALVKRLGGRPSGSVSKKTTRLVAGPGAGSKLTKAQALALPVLNEEEFYAWLSELGYSP